MLTDQGVGEAQLKEFLREVASPFLFCIKTSLMVSMDLNLSHSL